MTVLDKPNVKKISKKNKTFEQTILLFSLRGQITQFGQTQGAVASKGLVTGDTY